MFCARCGNNSWSADGRCQECGQTLPVVPVGPPPSGQPLTLSSAPPARPGGNKWPAVIAGVIVVIAILAAGVLIGRSGSSSATSTTTTVETSTTTTAPPTTSPRGPVEQIVPISASASNVRSGPVRLKCGGVVSYDASNIVDRDPGTGWGASKSDGTGQSVTVDLGGVYRLSSIDVAPGYLRNGPRQDRDCMSVFAFPFNRILRKIRYDFDNGASQEVWIDPQNSSMQRINVDVLTRNVTMTILETVRPEGADDDTIVSELAIFGSR